MISVRVATKDDQDFIFGLSHTRILATTTTKEEILTYFEDKNFLVLILLEGIEKAGYLCFRLEGQEAEIDELAILDQSEGKGEATYLLNYGLSLLKKENYQTVFLEVRENNKKAISLYERTGFKQYRRRENYYLTVSALCYKKEL